MEHTTYYQLSLWEQDDRIMREDFNADNAKLDAALKTNADAITSLGTSKANAAALGAETTARENADTALGGRIDSEAQARQNADSAEATARTNADTALGGRIDSEVAAREAAVNAINANLGSHGHNARMVTGSYVGTGTYGSSKPNTLTFDFCPVVVFVSLNKTSYGWMVRPFAQANAYDSQPITVAWTDHSISWYNANQAGSQCNEINTTYHYIAIGYDE